VSATEQVKLCVYNPRAVLLHGPADASAGAFAPLSARKAAAPAAQAVKKFCSEAFIKTSLKKAESYSRPPLINSF
jgi:hypothetical protein